MNFYESMVNGFVENIRAVAGFQKEDFERWAAELMKDAACQALEKIRGVLDDDRLDDQECFSRIEEIVKIYEEIGSDAGTRHDF